MAASDVAPSSFAYGAAKPTTRRGVARSDVGRPETDQIHGMRDDTRIFAMTQLGNGLSAGGHYADALSVREAELSTLRRLGAPEECILITQSNLANTYQILGQAEKALRARRDTYSGWLKLKGEDDAATLCEASNLAFALASLVRFDEAKALLRRMMPVARRAVGSSHITTLRTRFIYAAALYEDPAATLDDLREAVTTLEDTIRIARRVLGGVHPTTEGIEQDLRDARAALRARVSPEEWRAAARGVKITN